MTFDASAEAERLVRYLETNAFWDHEDRYLKAYEFIERAYAHGRKDGIADAAEALRRPKTAKTTKSSHVKGCDGTGRSEIMCWCEYGDAGGLGMTDDKPYWFRAGKAYCRTCRKGKYAIVPGVGEGCMNENCSEVVDL